MSESHADNMQALGLALLLHALFFVVFFSASQGTRHAARDSAPGAISVNLVDAGALSAAMQRALRDLPEATGEVLPEPKTELELDAKRMPIMQAETKSQLANALDEVAAPTQLGRQREAMRKQAQTQVEVERKKQADDIREQRAAPFAKQDVEHIEPPQAEGAPGDSVRADARGSSKSVSVDTGLAARYTAALLTAITAKWTRPDSIPADAVCPLIISQRPGGEVLEVQVSSPCAYDEQGRRSIESAVLKAQPLPYQGFEAVFKHDMTLNFHAEDR